MSSATSIYDSVTWGYCAVDCPGRCPMRFYVKDGRIVRTEPWIPPKAGRSGYPVPRPCARGRALAEWVNSDERLKWPLRRVGPRGSGEFERITWDEAIDLACSELQRIIETYGNEAVYLNYGTGSWASTSKPFERLLSLLGGYLGRYNNYSNAQINCAARYMYGSADQGSSLSQAERAQTIVAFGFNPAGTRQGAASDQYFWPRIARSGAKVYLIDPLLNDSAAAFAQQEKAGSQKIAEGVFEWVPIRPGTDAALVAGIAHEFVINNQVDRTFLHRYCVGFDEQSMPFAYRDRDLSYEAYLMGLGYDHVEKTAAWAADITRVPQEKVRELAHAIACADPLYVTQGWGPQRRSNGEWTAWSIMMLPCLVGQVGKPGTNNGERERSASLTEYGLPRPANPVSASIPAYLFTEAIAHPETMTAKTAGVRGAPRLHCGIKYLINYAGNCLTNQHGNINHTHDILADESLCEFILGMDVSLTDSMKHCDVVLPDLFRLELFSQASAGTDGAIHLVTGSPALTRRHERKSAYEVCTLMARRLGVEETFTEGKTELDWAREAHERMCAAHPELALPSWEEALAAGVVQVPLGEHIALEDFVRDPEGNPLATPSGKIELFSEKLLRDTQGWRIQPDEAIGAEACILPPFPAYVSEWHEGATPAQNVKEEWPLRLVGYHFAGRVHSSYGSVPGLQEFFPQHLLMSPFDARTRGLNTGDWVLVRNQFGATMVQMQVSKRVMPGVVALPQGAWHAPSGKDDKTDRAGSINVLTGSRPSPLAKGNPQHTIFCEVVRAEEDVRAEGPQTLQVSARGPLHFLRPDFSSIRGAHPDRIAFDPQLCTGCRACMMACAERFGQVSCWVEECETGEFPQVRVSFEGSFCGRCAKPACVAACPSYALSVE